MRQVISAMPKGIRLLTIDASGTRNLTPSNSVHVSYHASLVAVIDRDAFAPTLFTGEVVVKPAPALKASSTPLAYPYPDLDQFVDGYGRADPTAEIPTGGGGRVYWYGWERKFDYVLVMHYGNRPTTLPAILQLVASSKVADLYSIGKLQEIRPH